MRRAAILAAMALPACAPPPEFTPPPAAAPAAAAPAASPAPVPATVPATAFAPGGAFRISDLPAAWDGAETTGGLWVALPYLPAYRRVLIRNPETGETVVARLFWRDAGPAEAALSAEAALALGLEPGRAMLEATVLE